MTDVQESQNISSITDRFLAYMMDWSIIISVNLIIWPIIATYVEDSTSVIIILFMETIVFYNVLFEILLKGQTPGKKSRNIKIVKLDGSLPHLGHYLLRWIARPLNFLCLGLIAFVKIRGRKGWQLTDLISKTVVIRKKDEIVETIAEPKIKDKPEVPNSLIDNIAEASKNARKIYLLFIGLLAYSALTAVSTSDRRIILNEPAHLPVINLDVSLDGFFILAPILSIFIFIYFQLYLHKLKRLIDDLRKNYQPIKEDQEIYPWMINFVDELGYGFIAATQRFIVKFSIWWSLPTVLTFLALWYIKKHHPVLMGIVGIMPLIGTFIVIVFFIHYQQPAGYNFNFNSLHIKAFLKKNKEMRIMLIAILILEIYIFTVFIPRALRGEQMFGSWPAVDLSNQNLVNRQDEEFKTVYWANQRQAKLQGANLRGTILKRADLRDANLQGANLIEALLQGANLRTANLKGANLSEARMQGTDLQNADLSNVNIQGAKLDSADLRGVIIDNSNLIDANLTGAKFDTVSILNDAVFSNNQIDLEWLRDEINFKNINLRAIPDTLSNDSVKKMITKNNFFDLWFNPSGSGLCNMFELQHDGKVVMDFASNLIWQQGGSQERMNFEDAKKWIKELNQNGYAGFHDWRLPTLEEAMSLMEPEQKNGRNINPIFGVKQWLIWTADAYQGAAGQQWIVLFDFSAAPTPSAITHYVRAVRFGQSSP